MDIFSPRKSTLKSNINIARAFRYSLAMNLCSKSRIYELLPIVARINPDQNRLLDLMSGNGFISQYFGNAFLSVDALDKTTKFYVGSKNTNHVLKCDAADECIVSKVSKKYDHIISLSGLHHLLPCASSNIESHDTMIDYRTQCLTRWKSLLSDRGRLIIVDVPSIHQVSWDFFPYAPASTFPLIENALQSVGYFEENTFISVDPKPTLFFDQFVDQNSITPHTAHFETESSLSLMLESAGYSNIQAATFFTPWIFDNTCQAIWFFHQLFGIGMKTYHTPDEIPQDLTSDILTAIRKFLGCGYTETGKFWVGWKLFYLSGDQSL